MRLAPVSPRSIGGGRSTSPRGGGSASPRGRTPKLRPLSARPAVVSDDRSTHKYKVWRALHSKNMETRIEHWRNMADSAFFEPIGASGSSSKSAADELRAYKARRSLVKPGGQGDAGANSQAVNDRIFQALARQGGHKTRSTLEVDELMQFVSQVQPLKMLGERVRRALCELATSRTYESGQMVCRHGEHADTFFIILSGSVQVRHTKPPSRHQNNLPLAPSWPPASRARPRIRCTSMPRAMRRRRRRRRQRRWRRWSRTAPPSTFSSTATTRATLTSISRPARGQRSAGVV